MAAQQRDSCKNEFGAENQRDEQLFICPHLSLSSPALGLSWLALQEGKLTFEHHCYCPVEEIKMHIHGLAFGLFLMASSREVTLFSALSVVGCTTGADLKVSEAAPSWKSCTGTETTGLEGVPHPWNDGMRHHQEGQGKVQECGADTQLWEESQKGAQGYMESCRNRATHAFPTHTNIPDLPVEGWMIQFAVRMKFIRSRKGKGRIINLMEITWFWGCWHESQIAWNLFSRIG